MGRLRAIVALALTLALVAAACTEDGAQVSTVAPAAEGGTVAADGSSDEPAGSDAAQTVPDVEESSVATLPEDDSGDGGIEEGLGADGSSDEEPTGTATTAAPTAADGDLSAGTPEAVALLASATSGLSGRAVRGEATIEAPVDTGPTGTLTTRFESDVDGDIAVTLDIPPDMDGELPEGGEAEFRYVDGVQYVRPPASIAAAVGLEADAWLIVMPSSTGEPSMADGLGLMCVFPQLAEAPVSDCDPLADVLSLTAVAQDATVVGREEVRGAETTRVSISVPLLGLLGEALGEMPGDVPDDVAEAAEGEGMGAMFEELLSSLGIAADLWIDDDMMIRRISLDLSSMMTGLPGAETEDLPPFRMMIEYYDFDADISVEAPPPELVVGDSSILG